MASTDAGTAQQALSATEKIENGKAALVQLWIVRHGETEWSLSGQHTGRTDLPLIATGRERAVRLKSFFDGRQFALVLTSPRQRAMETCRLAGYGDVAVVDPNLQEWDYGEYEGRTSHEIQAERPGWSIWNEGVVGGETIQDVARRAQAVIDRATSASGDVLLFAHGHILRILTSCWLALAPQDGRLFALGTASVSVLGHEHTTRVITHWNDRAACAEEV
jgi:broad specificity phosphatase PhoE